MAIKILKDYLLGDMIARYLLDGETGSVGFQLLPAVLPTPENVAKSMKMEPLVQLKLTGDIYDEAYALGNCLRNGETVRRLAYKDQSCVDEGAALVISTTLADDRGYEVTHRLSWKKGAPYVRISACFENKSADTATLEMFASFSLGGLSPYLEGDGYERLNLHRVRAVWSMEGRHECIPVEELQLEPAWDPHAVRCEKFGQVGSMPVNKFFPFAAIEDKETGVFWGAQIAHNASWQMEVYRKDDGLALSGGLADRDFGHWLKNVAPGEAFSTPEAIVTTAKTNSFDILTGRLTQAASDAMVVPEWEEDLPLVFNEYCTTWGNPSHENIAAIVDTIRDKGFKYFVIDCGWYKEDGVPWDIAMGDYNVSDTLFPDGLEKTVKVIKDAGMIPGLWFEIENIGRAARAYQNTDHLLHRDGKVLTSYFRRFWDQRDPWVERYLSEKVIGTLQKYGFGYMKIDYNETIGLGCDGAESLGEGLRQNMAAAAEFIEKVKREIPGIVLENCSSGGHRLEPSLMAQMSMASFSDAHECPEIPIIAAGLHRVIHPRQSQIWAVIRTDDSLKRIAYSLANTFLGRLCISGDVMELSGEQWAVLDAGMDFYKRIAHIIKDGQSYLHHSEFKSYRHPKGWQVLVRTGKDGEAFAVIHTFDGELPEEISVQLPEGCGQKVAALYSDSAEAVMVKDGILIYHPTENFKAVAVHLVK